MAMHCFTKWMLWIMERDLCLSKYAQFIVPDSLAIENWLVFLIFQTMLIVSAAKAREETSRKLSR